MEAKYEYTPLYYGTPCQVRFYEGFEKQYRYGIAYHEEIFCGCCGLIYRIESVIRDAEREGIEAFEKVDMSAYTKTVFGMFGGKEQKVKLRFANYLVGVVLDRFGRETTIIPDGDGHFTVTLNVVVSPQFFGWVFGFGKDIEILSPESVRTEMKKQAEDIFLNTF